MTRWVVWFWLAAFKLEFENDEVGRVSVWWLRFRLEFENDEVGRVCVVAAF